MSKKIKDIVCVVLCAVLIFGGGLWCALKPADAFSESERRVLAAMPQFSLKSFTNGDFTSKFETYTLDQFPFRDSFRTIKAVFNLGVLRRADNNGIYLSNGYASKLEYPYREDMLTHASQKFEYIYNAFISGSNAKAYFSLIPDKNCFAAPINNHPSLDYDAFANEAQSKLSFAEYIDIMPLLSLEDYYKTDTHWRQEKIVDVAQALAEKMGGNFESDYAVNKLQTSFYGVYCGQSALPLKPDELFYLTNSATENAVVTSFESGSPKRVELYSLKNGAGRDAYELFLSGPSPLLKIENKAATSEKELVVFGDSFSSSLVPLLLQSYKTVTVVDIRYIQSSMLGSFIDFSSQDVLFIYSTLLLNNSTALH